MSVVQRRNPELVEMLRPDFVSNDGSAFPTFEAMRMTYLIRDTFSKLLIDGVATNVFQIETINEPGNTDGGTYSCLVHAVVANGSSGSGAGAAASFVAQFARMQTAFGTGTNSAISEVCEVIVAAGANRTITGITMTALEATEYLINVQFTVVHAGALAADLRVSLTAELMWNGFLTSPIMRPI